MDKVLTAVVVILVTLVIQHLWSSRSPSLETIFENIDAPRELKEHTKEFAVREVVEVRDGVYVALNYGIANSIMLIGPEGRVIIDTLENYQAAQEVEVEFRKLSEAETKAIIYTHHHTDHCMGTKAFIETRDESPQIWAHHLFHEQEEKTYKKGQALLHRARYQFGMDLPKGHLNCGIGGKVRFAPGSPRIPPTHLVQDDMDITLGGIPMRFIHIPGETADQMGVWLPERRILFVADDIYKAFPNLYAIRGTAPRDVNDWVNSLDKMRKLRAECIVGSHYKPTCGEDKVYQLLTDYMHGIQFVHDQTVRFINKGMHPDEIVKRVKLPKELATHPYLLQFYGTVPWSVKAVYISYLGWFSGYPEDLYTLAPSDRAERMVSFMGKKGLLNAAETALAKSDNQWALELASYVHKIEPSNKLALDIRQRAMVKLAESQISANGRNFYMTAMMQDAGLLTPRDIKANVFQISIKQLFMNMRMRLKAEEVPDNEHIIGCFHFEDKDVTVCLTIHRGIIELAYEQLDEYDFKVTTTETAYKELIVGKRSTLMSYFTGAIKVEGGLLKLRRFMNYIDRD